MKITEDAQQDIEPRTERSDISHHADKAFLTGMEGMEGISICRTGLAQRRVGAKIRIL
jgi:hypothetical protein